MSKIFQVKASAWIFPSTPRNIIKFNLQSTTFWTLSHTPTSMPNAFKLENLISRRRKKKHRGYLISERKVVSRSVPFELFFPESNLACRFRALTNFPLIVNMNGQKIIIWRGSAINVSSHSLWKLATQTSQFLKSCCRDGEENCK